MGTSRTPFSTETPSRDEAGDGTQASEIEKKMVEEFSSEMGRKYRLISEKNLKLRGRPHLLPPF